MEELEQLVPLAQFLACIQEVLISYQPARSVALVLVQVKPLLQMFLPTLIFRAEQQ